MNRVDAIVFTAGVGERGPILREVVLKNMEELGIKLDNRKNYISMTRDGETLISAEDSRVKIFIIPTDEELVMTEDTYALLKGNYDVHTNFTYSFQSRDYVNLERAATLEEKYKEKPKLREVIAPIP